MNKFDWLCPPETRSVTQWAQNQIIMKIVLVEIEFYNSILLRVPENFQKRIEWKREEEWKIEHFRLVNTRVNTSSTTWFDENLKILTIMFFFRVSALETATLSVHYNYTDDMRIPYFTCHSRIIQLHLAKLSRLGDVSIMFLCRLKINSSIKAYQFPTAVDFQHASHFN